MLAYGHGWEELEATDQRGGIPILTAPVLKGISALHYHNRKACTLQQVESLELHIIFLPKLVAL